MTLGDAYEKMSVVIRKFIETIRDIVTITKTQRVSKTDLEVVVADLVAISLAIQSMFRKESLIDSKFMENYKNEIAQNPDKQSLTSEEPAENLGLAGKGLEKLKKMFSWMSDEIAELFNKFFGEDNVFTTALSQSDMEEVEKQEIVEKVVETTTWFDSLEDEQKTAVGAFSKTLIDKKRQLQEEEETFANLSFINDIARNIEMNINDVGEAYQQLEEDQKGIFKKVVEVSFQELVGYLKGVLRVKETLGTEASEELIDKVLDDAAALKNRSGFSNDTSDEEEGSFERSRKQTKNVEIPTVDEEKIDNAFESIDLDQFGGKKQIREFWKLIAKALGSLNNIESKLDENYGYNKRTYGKLDNLKYRATNSLLGKNVIDAYDQGHIGQKMRNFFKYIIESEAGQVERTSEDGSKEYYPDMTSSQSDRMLEVCDAFAEKVLEKSKDISFEKQLAPFMRFIKRLEKNTDKWYKSSAMHDIIKQFKWIIEEKGLFDYIMGSDHNNNTPSGEKQQESPPPENNDGDLEESLKPIIEKMLKEHYNY
jgi:hypothetical protein